jgi:HEAT repeat-containing protein 6
MARLLSRNFGSNSLTENSRALGVLVSIISCLQAELNLSEKPSGTGISSHVSGSANNKNSNTWDMKISAFSMMEDLLCKVASNISDDLWQSAIEVSALCVHLS